MKYILLIATCLSFSACGRPVFSADDVDTKDYVAAATELVDKKELVQNIMPVSDKLSTGQRTITPRDFNFYVKLPALLPKCAKLFAEEKALRITYYTDECVWIVLRSKEHMFNTHYQCLKVGTKVDCDPYNAATLVETKKLGDGLLYKEVKIYGD